MQQHAINDAIAVLRIGGSFDEAEEMTGIPAAQVRRLWDQNAPEEGDVAHPEHKAA